MRWIVLLSAAILCGPANAQMMQAIVGGSGKAGQTWTVVGSASCGMPSGGPSCTTSAIDTTGANLIVFGAGGTQGQALVITDNKGNPNPTAVSGLGGAVGPSVQVATAYYISPTVGAGHTFTVTEGGTAFANLTVLALKDATGTPSLDAPRNSNCAQSVTTIQPGSVTPSTNNVALVSTIIYNDSSSGSGTLSINSGFQTPPDKYIAMVTSANYAGAISHLAQSTAAAVNPTWTATQSANDFCVALVGFKP